MRQRQPAVLQSEIAIVFAQFTVKRREQREHFDLQIGLRLELVVDMRRTRVQQFACGDLAAWLVGGNPGIVRLENANHEVPDRGGTGGFLAGRLRLP